MKGWSIFNKNKQKDIWRKEGKTREEEKKLIVVVGCVRGGESGDRPANQFQEEKKADERIGWGKSEREKEEKERNGSGKMKERERQKDFHKVN